MLSNAENRDQDIRKPHVALETIPEGAHFASTIRLYLFLVRYAAA